jgi:hypothetical protein
MMAAEPAASFVVRPGAELAERLRNAVAHLGGDLTVQAVLADAVRKAVEGLERDHNNGQPFPQRPAEQPRRKPSGEVRKKQVSPPAIVRAKQRREADGPPGPLPKPRPYGKPAPRRPGGPRRPTP